MFYQHLSRYNTAIIINRFNECENDFLQCKLLDYNEINGDTLKAKQYLIGGWVSIAKTTQTFTVTVFEDDTISFEAFRSGCLSIPEEVHRKINLEHTLRTKFRDLNINKILE